MEKPEKLSLSALREGMQVFLTFPEVESDMRAAKIARVSAASEFVSKMDDGQPGSVTDIIRMLCVKTAKEYQTRLQYLLATTPNGSLEQLDRVCMSICPERDTWNQRRMSYNATKAIAKFLKNPDFAPDVPWFIREKFRLPDDFLSRIRFDIESKIHKSLQSQYNTDSGLAVESTISGIVTAEGYAYDKGKVRIVDDKEVDVSVPDLVLPRILIMAAYHLTTSSTQSNRAREQQTMYEHVQTYNNLRDNRELPDVQMVNVIDGGGWMRRSGDLAEIHRYCDYALSVSQLQEHLPPVLHYHMQQRTL